MSSQTILISTQNAVAVVNFVLLIYWRALYMH